MAIFADRVDAGRQLAAALHATAVADAIVLGIPRGGVVVAAEVARRLHLPLAAVPVRKLGAPDDEEFAVGAIAEGVRVMNEEGARRVAPADLEPVEKRERLELARRARLFAAAAYRLAGRTALVVDDGIATGATALAACRSLRAQHPARIVLAVPVAPAKWTPAADAVDEFVCPHLIGDFWAVGRFYADFTQTTDDEVARLLSGDLAAEN